jgi:hypothetical protein
MTDEDRVNPNGADSAELPNDFPEGCEPLDPDWIVSVDHYRLLSVNVTMRSGSETLSAALRDHLSPFHHDKREHESITLDLYPIAGSPPGETWYAFDEAGSEPRRGLLEDLFNHIVWRINTLVPARAGDYLFLHAGSVARGGRALLLPAERDTGKSTTTLALLENGFDYLSDEFGAIDPITSRAYPFPKKLMVSEESLEFFPGLDGRLVDRTGGGPHLYQRAIRPDDLDARVAAPSRVGAVIFLANDHEGPARLDATPKAEAIREMAANAFNLYRYQERGLVLLSRLVADAETFRLSGGTPRERASLIGDRFTP